MKKIASFCIDHIKLNPGLYLSRQDILGNEIVSTYDCRLTAPNREPAVAVAALHAIEHLIATFLRNHPKWSNEIIYWGPMGCCTGNYLIVKGEPKISDIQNVLIEAFEYVSNYDGEIPGATPKDCGNYLSMHLPEAKMAAIKYLKVLRSADCPLKYPV